MKKPGFALLSSSALVMLGLGLIALYSSCGSTGGGVNPSAASGQFVSQSCSPELPNGGGACLSLSTVGTVAADGVSVGTFRARFVDGSGVPIDGARLCFAFENPAVATLLEPTNGCGLTDANGLVSGRFRAGTIVGSFQLVATAEAGFGLQTRRTVEFTSATGVTQNPGNVNSPCATDADCNAALFCSFNDTCDPGESICKQRRGTGGCCADDSQCISDTCGDAGACVPEEVAP